MIIVPVAVGVSLSWSLWSCPLLLLLLWVSLLWSFRCCSCRPCSCPCYCSCRRRYRPRSCACRCWCRLRFACFSQYIFARAYSVVARQAIQLAENTEWQSGARPLKFASEPDAPTYEGGVVRKRNHRKVWQEGRCG